MSKDYGSKVDLNDKPEVLRINKVEAQDFNDIATDIEWLDQAVGSLASKSAGYCFDGNNAKIIVPDNAKIVDIFKGGGTIEILFNANSELTAVTNRVLDKGSILIYSPSVYNDTYCIRLYVIFDGGTGTWTTDKLLSINKEEHLCITYDSSSTTNTPIFYLNSEAIPIIDTDIPSGTLVSDSGTVLGIGNRNTGDRPFSGSILKLRTFNKIKTATEISNLYSNKNIEYKEIGASQTTVTTGSFIVGKEYRIITVGDTDFTLIGASANTVGIEFTATGVGGGTTGEAIQIGCVGNYISEGVETNQWKDVSGNNNNGDVDEAILINKWGKTESVEYSVSSSKTFTLPKDFIITNVMYENASGSTGDLKIGFGTGTNEIVNQTSIVTGTVSSIHATVGKAVNADDTIYITTTQEMTVKVLMERV